MFFDLIFVERQGRDFVTGCHESGRGSLNIKDFQRGDCETRYRVRVVFVLDSTHV
jgi:hypothetical protein